MKPLRHWFRSTSCLKEFFSPLNRTTSYFIPLAVCLSAYVMVLFTVIHFLFVVSTFCFLALQETEMEKLQKMRRVRMFLERKMYIYSAWCSFLFFTAAVWKTCLLGAVSGTNTASSSRNIWVSGLSSNTKAADLKNLFGKYGKVDNVFFVCGVN